MLLYKREREREPDTTYLGFESFRLALIAMLSYNVQCIRELVDLNTKW